MQIQLVISDIDGVLLVDGIDPQINFDALRFIKDHLGIKTSVATGRPGSLALPVLDVKALTGPLICENGGSLVDLNGNILRSTVVPETIKSFFDTIFHLPNICTISFAPNEEPDRVHMFEADSDEIQKLIAEYNMVKTRTTKNWDEFKHWMYSLSFSKIIIIMKDQFSFVPVPNSIPHCHSAHQGRIYYDITAEGVSKGTAVIEVADQLNIPLDQVMVFGNDYNDIPMFEIPHVKKVAINHQNRLPIELREKAHLVISPRELKAAFLALGITH